MTSTRVKRYFRYQAVDVNGLAAVRDIFNSKDGFDIPWKYTLRYPAEDIEVSLFADLQSVVVTKGNPKRCKISVKSSGGRYGCFDAISSDYISVEYYSKKIDPSTQIDKVQKALSLHPPSAPD